MHISFKFLLIYKIIHRQPQIQFTYEKQEKPKYHYIHTIHHCRGSLHKQYNVLHLNFHND